MRGRRSGDAWGHALLSSVFSHHAGIPIAPEYERTVGDAEETEGALLGGLSAYSVTGQ